MLVPESRFTAIPVGRAAGALLLLLLIPSPALAGTIFGNLTEAGRSVGRGVEVRILCGKDAPLPTMTDEYGAYTISLPRPGRCDLVVLYKGRVTPPYPIASSDDPARYDFDLVFENNQYVLKRR